MSWTIEQSALPSGQEDFLSTVFHVGNGHACTRGALMTDGLERFRGTYVAGLYTRAGYGLNYFLAAPEWPAVRIRSGEKALRPISAERRLDMRRGLLEIDYVFRDAGAELRVREERFCSLKLLTLLCQRLSIEVVSAEQDIELLAGIDADVRNHRAKYFTPGQLPNSDPYGLKLSHVETCQAGEDWGEAVIQSPQVDKRMAMAAVVCQPNGKGLACRPRVEGGLAGVAFRIPAGSSGASHTIEKLCRFVADIEGKPTESYRRETFLAQLAERTFEKALADHEAAWEAFWDIADVQIDGDDDAQRKVRYGLYATRVAAPDDRGLASIGAKNLSGDWYRGAVFWDMEMYQLPLLSAVAPNLAANHILYRHRRLDAARTLAKQDGYDGARFPWHSYMTGLEEPPAIGGFLYQQIHLNVAVPYGICQHWLLTGDDDLMLTAGLEILVEQCRFWCSRASEGTEGRVHIREVCGPDEVHKTVDDNAYTNLMAAWVLRQTDALVARFSAEHPDRTAELLEGLSLTDDERAGWRDVADRLHVPELPNGAFAQFEGFDQYAEPSAAARKAESGSDKTNKQADTLMLYQALPAEFDSETMRANFDEYAPLCTQTSSLSMCTHALLAARLGRRRDAMRYFTAAAGVDLDDSYANTRHGIHGAGEGGIWLTVVQGFGGLTVGSGGLSIAPRLPESWDALRYAFLHRGQKIRVEVEPARFRVVNDGKEPVELALAGERQTVPPGDPVDVPLSSDWAEPGLQGVIFDLDGVLVSTDEFHYRAWKALADDLGLAFDREINHRLRGVSREESLRVIYRHNNVEIPDDETLHAQCSRKNTQYVGLIDSMTPADVLPGARELLAALRQAGIRCAVASASRNAPRVLERTGLGELLDAVVDGSCVTAAKPDPQGFLLAAQRLRVLPWNCIGVEDASSGIEAIRSAGMLSAGVGSAAADGDMTVSEVSELSAEALKSLFSSRENPINPYMSLNLKKVRSEET